MIIELMKPVLVRIPETSEFHEFPEGTMVNYSAEHRAPDHMVHKFVAKISKGGFAHYMCVTERHENPDWI